MARPKGSLKAAAVAAILIVLALLLVLRVSAPKGKLKLPVGSGVPAISLGERHGLILASDGSLWSWGSDFLGWPVLGFGTNTRNTAVLRRIGGETNWVSIAAGADHNLAIKSDGTLWGWGENIYYQLGDGTRLTRGTPVRSAPGNDWKQVACRGAYTVALKKNGTLWAWGDNWCGQLGLGHTNRPNPVPAQIGSSTNWVKVWTGLLETVALQSDGSLWYWGDNPNPTVAQGAGLILVPTRVSPDTNWVDVGFGPWTVFAIKSDGTLWAWGRNAHVCTGVSDQALDVAPARVGTNGDWRSICDSTGWWSQGLIKRDGSLWLMDASQGKPNGPQSPYKPVEFRRINFTNSYAAYCAGAVHAAPSGVHGPIGVVLTRDGEVWTWGMALGDPPTLKSRFLEFGARLLNNFGFKNKITSQEPDPIYRQKPWQLPNQ